MVIVIMLLLLLVPRFACPNYVRTKSDVQAPSCMHVPGVFTALILDPATEIQWNWKFIAVLLWRLVCQAFCSCNLSGVRSLCVEFPRCCSISCFLAILLTPQDVRLLHSTLVECKYPKPKASSLAVCICVRKGTPTSILVCPFAAMAAMAQSQSQPQWLWEKVAETSPLYEKFFDEDGGIKENELKADKVALQSQEGESVEIIADDKDAWLKQRFVSPRGAFYVLFGQNTGKGMVMPATSAAYVGPLPEVFIDDDGFIFTLRHVVPDDDLQPQAPQT